MKPIRVAACALAATACVTAATTLAGSLSAVAATTSASTAAPAPKPRTVAYRVGGDLIVVTYRYLAHKVPTTMVRIPLGPAMTGPFTRVPVTTLGEYTVSVFAAPASTRHRRHRPAARLHVIRVEAGFGGAAGSVTEHLPARAQR